MRFICIIAIAISFINSSPVLADPIDNTNEFIQKMAHEGESQNDDEVSQPENGSSIEWGDEATDPDEKTEGDSESEAKMSDEGQVQKGKVE